MTQAESITIITEQAIAFFNENPEGLILLGAYNIGKERVICGLQDALNMNVYMEDRKLKLMKCLGSDIMSRVDKGTFVTNARRARVHVCRMGFAGTIGVCDDDDDVYLRLQHGKGFHNLVYMSYVKHKTPDSKA
jgi:hypothetical protein